MDMSCLLLYFVILFDAVAYMVCFPAVSLFGLYLHWHRSLILFRPPKKKGKRSAGESTKQGKMDASSRRFVNIN